MNQTEFEHHTWAEIDLDALTRNFTEIQKRAGGTPLCAVVKADAYGHGAVMVGKTLLAAGAKQLAVSCLAEALELREAGITADILLLGHTDPQYSYLLVKHNITQSCYSLEIAQSFANAIADYNEPRFPMISPAEGLSDAEQRALIDETIAEAMAEAEAHKLPPLKLHLKLDTGMGRIGFALRHDFDAAMADVLACYDLEGVAITGVFQHFAVCDSTTPENITYTEEQHALFTKAIDCLTAAGHTPALAHCNNSAGTLLHPTYPESVNRAQTMARPGIILYGLNPSDEVTFDFLKPVMQFKTVVSHVKTLEIGESTSYGRHFVAEKPTVVATLCAGYADGYPRLLSRGKGTVIIHGKPAEVIGNVCMDQMMIDVTDIPNIKEGDPVILWGGKSGDSADDVAAKIGTIGYEIVCGVSRRVPRVYTKNRKPVLVNNYLQYRKPLIDMDDAF